MAQANRRTMDYRARLVERMRLDSAVIGTE